MNTTALSRLFLAAILSVSAFAGSPSWATTTPWSVQLDLREASGQGVGALINGAILSTMDALLRDVTAEKVSPLTDFGFEVRKRSTRGDLVLRVGPAVGSKRDVGTFGNQEMATTALVRIAKAMGKAYKTYLPIEMKVTGSLGRDVTLRIEPSILGGNATLTATARSKPRVRNVLLALPKVDGLRLRAKVP